MILLAHPARKRGESEVGELGGKQEEKGETERGLLR